jgi:hypothetical protein
VKITIPAEILTQHVAVLGKTGSGKTSTGKLLIEQVVDGGARVCVLDPIKSDWWGLTSSADGKRAGLPFHILGGPRGHVPLHAGAGKPIAEIVANGALPLSIIDMADFEPGGQAKFFVDFAATLLRKMRGVVYLVIEEAHLFAPKERSGIGAENLSIHWAKTLATAGRSKGVRLVLVTQRTQALHNALLGSCDTMIAHRLTAPADQEPVIKWLKANTSKDVMERVTSSLASLKTGDAWLCSGEAKRFEVVHFPRISTYDNTATPTGDGEIRDIKTAPVDQDKLRAIIGDAVEQAKADDPRELRKQIAELKKQITAAQIHGSREVAKVETKTVEKFVLKDGQLARAEKIVERAEALLTKLVGVFEDFGETALVQALRDSAKEIAGAIRQTQITPTTTARPVEQRSSPHARGVPPGLAQGTSTRPARVVSPASSNGHVKPAQQKILNGLAFLHGIGLSHADKTQLALIVGVSPTSGGYFNNLGTLRSSGYIDYPTGGTVALTEMGRGIASDDGVPSSTAELHAAIRAKLPPAKWKIVEELIRAYPHSVSKDDLAQAIGVSPTSGGFFNNLGSLRSLGLIDYPQPGTAAALSVLFLDR